jgi:hypothetical protein
MSTTPSTPFNSGTKVHTMTGLTTRFGNTVLSQDEYAERSSVMDEAMRSKLSPKERLTFYSTATTGLTTKFTLNDNISDIDDVSKSGDFMNKNLHFTLLLQDLKNHLKSNVMDSVFKILNIDPLTNLIIDDKYIDLLDDYTSLTLEDVQRSVAYYRQRSLKPLDAENNNWSMEFIINSCDDDLRTFIRSKLIGMDTKYHGGPTVFMILVQEIIHNNDNLARALTLRLESFKLSEIPGENIETLSSCILAICDRLECCNKLPHDIEKIILGILETCSVSKFTGHFSTLYSIKSPTLSTYKSILTEGCRMYRELRTGPKNQWLPLTKSGSMYTTSGIPMTPPHAPSPLPTHDNKGRLIDRNPPKGQTPHSRTTTDNVSEYWCSTCVRWGHHLTSGHDDWKKQMKERRAKRNKNNGTGSSTGSPGANPCVGSSPSTTDSSGGSPSSTSTGTGSSGVMVQNSSSNESSGGSTVVIASPMVNTAAVNRILRSDD